MKKWHRKMEIISSLWRFYLNKVLILRIKTTYTSVNLYQSNNCCLSSQSKDSVHIKVIQTTYYLHFSMLIFPSILTLKYLNTMLCNWFSSTIFTSRIFFCYNGCMDLNAPSMSELLAISLALEWKNLWSFFF